MKTTVKWHPMNGYNWTDEQPKERKVYLVTYETPNGRRYVRDLQCSYSGVSPRYVGWSKKINGSVIAWAELPEPYEP